jgi:cytochrome c oxidase subunit 1
MAKKQRKNKSKGGEGASTSNKAQQQPKPKVEAAPASPRKADAPAKKPTAAPVAEGAGRRSSRLEDSTPSAPAASRGEAKAPVKRSPASPAKKSDGNGSGNGRTIVVHGHAAEILEEMKRKPKGLHVSPDHVHEPVQTFWRKYLFSTDHKVIGIQFMFASLAFLVVAGALALMVRWQIGFPGQPMPGGTFLHGFAAPDGSLPNEAYNQAFTMHASLMIFFVIIPMLVGAFGNFLIPLQIGARDMAFPFLNGLSFWLAILAGTVMSAGFLMPGGAASSGWTSYPPISLIQGSGQSAWLVSVFILGLSSIIGAVNYITTIINYRTPGMTLTRMPLTVWALFITAVLILFATPVLGSAMILQLMDRVGGTSFFVPYYDSVGGAAADALKSHHGGGHPLLFQHLFWFYSHPAVYIMILPAMGIVSEILSTFSRKPIFGYKAMVGAIGLIAFLGFIVWGHHMFVSGMNPYLGTTFMFSTMAIAIPSAIKTFNWLGTLWGGSIRFTTPMLFAVGFVSMFVIGGLSGIFMASTPVDIQIHDTYFIVGHIHYVLFGGSLFGIFAGIYHWYPKMFGKMMNETLGKIHFWITFITFNCTFFPMHILGSGGMMRRIPDPTYYEFLRDIHPINVFVTVSALALGLGQLTMLFNFVGSLFSGAKRLRALRMAATAFCFSALVAAFLLAQRGYLPEGKLMKAKTFEDIALKADAPEMSASVWTVKAGSPAAKAGVKPGDVIVSINGTLVADTEPFEGDDPTDANRFYALLDAQEPDVEVPLVVKRGGKEVTLKVSPKFNAEEEFNEIGVGLPDAGGLAVASVGAQGLQKGDVILSAGSDDENLSDTIYELDELKDVFAGLEKSSTAISFKVLRDGAERILTVPFAKSPAQGLFWNVFIWLGVALFLALMFAPKPTIRGLGVVVVAISVIGLGKIWDVGLDIAAGGEIYHGKYFAAEKMAELGRPTTGPNFPKSGAAIGGILPWLYNGSSVLLSFALVALFGAWAWLGGEKLGEASGDNPWEATTLEWVACTSPPWYANFRELPTVYHGPHEYNVPGLEQDWLPQTVSYSDAMNGGLRKKTKTA